MRQTARGVSRMKAIHINRVITCLSVSGALASYFWLPAGLVAYAFDIMLRAYLHFVAGVMAHESVHGHLGNSRSSNLWWGRIALLPTTVPYVTFRKTHLHHHASTNIPELDPDEFLNTRYRWQIPLRAFALPYHWVLWMRRTGQFTKAVRREYAINYLSVGVLYGALAIAVGWQRVLIGLLASATLHSLLLWYAFAIKTHAGYSMGAPATRSHNFQSRWLYWFSLGLSKHQVHHLQPRIAWSQMPWKS